MFAPKNRLELGLNSDEIQGTCVAGLENEPFLPTGLLSPGLSSRSSTSSFSTALVTGPLMHPSEL